MCSHGHFYPSELFYSSWLTLLSHSTLILNRAPQTIYVLESTLVRGLIRHVDQKDLYWGRKQGQNRVTTCRSGASERPSARENSKTKGPGQSGACRSSSEAGWVRWRTVSNGIGRQPTAPPRSSFSGKNRQKFSVYLKWRWGKGRTEKLLGFFFFFWPDW